MRHMCTSRNLAADLDQVVIAELCSPGYSFKHVPRKDGTGNGGVGMVYRSNLQVQVRISKKIK